jgi:hypothetical protein
MIINDLLTFQCPDCKGTIPTAWEHDSDIVAENVPFVLACPHPSCGWQGVQRLNPGRRPPRSVLLS